MEELELPILRVRSGFDDLPYPGYASPHAAGMDLRAAIESPVRLEPLHRKLIPTGISIALPPGHEAQVRPRSGLAVEKGLTVLNSPGTIDADYRGEIGVIAINLGQESIEIRRGDRIAQLVVAPVERVILKPMETLEKTQRGPDGFGSTGR